MPIEIRPFDQEADNEPVESDSRTAAFMESLRARSAAGDEKQQRKWDKAQKPAREPKPVIPARPDWLNDPSPQPASKSTNTRPFHTTSSGPKRKRSVPRNNDL